jgi:hypothetical protein
MIISFHSMIIVIYKNQIVSALRDHIYLICPNILNRIPNNKIHSNNSIK